jgi:DNA-binding GntR family transcriptional regulator
MEVAGLELLPLPAPSSGFIESDRRFHEILVEMAGNQRLLRTYRQAPLPVILSAEPEESTQREKMRQMLADHRQLCELLEQGRIDEAVV